MSRNLVSEFWHRGSGLEPSGIEPRTFTRQVTALVQEGRASRTVPVVRVPHDSAIPA